MATHKRGEKVYLDKDTVAEEIQHFMDCRDGKVYMAEFRDCSGYGTLHKAFFCEDSKSESGLFVLYAQIKNEWKKTQLSFNGYDNDTWEIIRDLINQQESNYVVEIRTYG